MNEAALEELTQNWTSLTALTREPDQSLRLDPFVGPLKRSVATPMSALKPLKSESALPKQASGSGTSSALSSDREACISTPSGVEKKSKALPSAEKKADDTDDDPEAHLSIQEVLSLRVEEFFAARQVRKDQQVAKMVLAECGFSFNENFQKKHAMKLEKGHWHRFLGGVLAVYYKRLETGLECKVCRALLESFNVPEACETVQKRLEAQNEVKTAVKSNTIAVCQDLGNEALDAAAEGAAGDAPIEEQPSKRPRRGRPRKGEKAEFNVLEFVRTQRENQYIFLTQQEAVAW